MYSSKQYDTYVNQVSIGKMCASNLERNTSLHEAFFNNQRRVIKYLTESTTEEAYYVNLEGKSGLYLAVEAGMEDVVKTILSNINSDVNEKYISQFSIGKSLINAAIKRRSTGISVVTIDAIPVSYIKVSYLIFI